MGATRNDTLERLLNQLADGTLAAADEQVLAGMLRTSTAARRQYRHFMTLHADLHWDYPAAMLSPETSGGSGRYQLQRKWHAAARWLAAALLLLVIAGGVLLTWRGTSGPEDDRRPLGRLMRLAGEVQLADRGGVQVITQEADLHAGATLHVVGLTGLAALRLEDGTQISLGGETRLECRREAGQTRIALYEGNLSASVAPQASGRPLVIRTSSAEMRVLGTRLAVTADDEISELGVQTGRVRLLRLADGKTVEVGSGQYAVVSPRAALESRPWPAAAETWQEDFETGLPDGWRYGQWLREGTSGEARGAVRAACRFALDGTESRLYRVTLPKRWMQGLWRLEADTQLHFTYKMSRPGWFHIMTGVRSDDLNPSHIGNYELQSNFWKAGPPDQWQTVSVPFSAFRKSVPGVPYAAIPSNPPRAGDVAYLLWFNTGDVDRGLVIDRIWIDRSSQLSEGSP